MVCRTGVGDRAVWHFAATMPCSLPSATLYCNVIQRVGKHISSLAPNASSNEPSNEHVFLCTASLRRQLCHFRVHISLGWNWLSRVEMQ